MGPVAKGRTLARDPEKWVPVFGKDHAQDKNLERDDGPKEISRSRANELQNQREA
jgi:hypothetical protein